MSVLGYSLLPFIFLAMSSFVIDLGITTAGNIICLLVMLILWVALRANACSMLNLMLFNRLSPDGLSDAGGKTIMDVSVP